MEQLSADHQTVLRFVVQLHALHEVLVATDILVFLGVTEDGQELVQLELLLTLLLGATHLLNDSIGGVQVEGSEAVTQVESVDGVVSIKVVDTEGEFSPFHIAGTQIHGCCWGRSCTLKIQKRHWRD